MSNTTDERLVRKTYSEIVAGYTVSKHLSKYIFIKHFSSVDLLEFDYKYDLALKEAIERGIPTESEKIKLLCRDSLWSQQKEKEIANLKEMITLLSFNKSKHYSPRDIKSFNDQLRSTEKDLIQLLSERAYQVGATAEIFARKKVDTEQVFHSFFHDPELKNRVFSDADHDDLDNDEINRILHLYEVALQSISHKNLRLAALSSDFQSMFSLSNNLYEFYGKPISKLTNSQVELARYGGYYKAILSDEVKPPQEVLNDPDDLEDWYNARRNIQEIIEKNNVNEQDGKTISIMGVSKKDLTFYGISTD